MESPEDRLRRLGEKLGNGGVRSKGRFSPACTERTHALGRRHHRHLALASSVAARPHRNWTGNSGKNASNHIIDVGEPLR